MLQSYDNAGSRSILEQIEFEQAEKILAKRTLPEFAPGDTVRANLLVREGNRERVQTFEGVCIARKGGGINASFTLRKISHGEGVERVIPDYSPLLESVEVVRRGQVRRAKLYYLRDLRGKAARIPERQFRTALTAISPSADPESKPRLSESVEKAGADVPISTGGIERRGDSSLLYRKSLSSERYQAMVSALTRLKALDDRAGGPQVRAAVAAAVEELPDGNGFDLRTSELALHIGEYLCPLMFSKDETVSEIARSGVSRIGSLVSPKHATPSAMIAEALASLELSAIITLDLEVAATEARLGVTAGDIFKEAVGETRADRPSVHVQVLVEDMRRKDISAVADFDVPSNEKWVVSSTVDGELKHKLITVIANGMEIFSARMNRRYNKIFLC